ncbi:MAG: cation:proton antiporter [Actinobacteria bacterium]|nr:cation:proton antiporter [Actinomycetota bacterium]
MVSLPLEQPAFVFAVLFVAILVAPLVAERLRAPGLIGLLLAGTLIGPAGLGLVARGGVVESLGAVGLLYLMFVSGLDLDLDGFEEYRRDSVLLGVLTFIVPAVAVVTLALAFDLRFAAAVMIGSAFTSHTLLTYPVVQRFGIVRNRAITATLGATLLCTVAALLMLAVAAAAGTGSSDLGFWVGFPIGLLTFGVVTLMGLPRLTRWVFRGVGQDRAVRLTFVLAAMFALSATADLVNIEPIVGAFLAGLAVNRFVGEGTTVRERLDVLGSALFIPLFLISTGMLIDPISVATNPRTLAMGAAFTGATLLSKSLAAWSTARLLGFDRNELGMMVSLTVGQAAGALAAVIVASDLGLVGQEVVDATVLVILVTALVAALSAQHFAPRVAVPPVRVRGLGQRVVVPVANPHTAGPLVELAGLVAGADHGAVVAVNVLDHAASPHEVDEHRKVTAEAERAALRVGAEAVSLVRIDASPTAGVLHTVVEHAGTSILMGWTGHTNRREAFFGSIIDAVIARASVPVLVAHPGSDGEIRRVVLSLTSYDLTIEGERTLELTRDVATRLATQAGVPLLVVGPEPPERLRALIANERQRGVEAVHDDRAQTVSLRDHTGPGDLVVTGVPPTRGRLARRALRVGRTVQDRTLIVAVPH